MRKVKKYVAMEFGNAIYISVQINNLVEIAASYAIQTIRQNGIYIKYKYIRIKHTYTFITEFSSNREKFLYYAFDVSLFNHNN